MTSTTENRPIAIWLLACCAVIFGMVVLGGVTRLTGSGLSMVEWAPILGVLPPLNQAEWEEAFRLYQQYPEYQLKNLGMDLAGFKTIFWFEYAHRLLGRLIGVIFLLPFLWFLFTGRIGRPLRPKLFGLFLLGGLQGLMGWYMVRSGLVDDPHVSPYRLTAHLGLAVVIYGWMFWMAMDLLFPRGAGETAAAQEGPRRFALAVSALVFVTILSGGFVAGTRAGFAYNTFPLMAGRLVPEGMLHLSPAWRNLFENVATVQFDHRLMATLLFIVVPLFWWLARRAGPPRRLRTGLDLLLAALALQITLGISTLLLVVPVPLAAAHQAGAILLFTASLFVGHQLARARGG